MDHVKKFLESSTIHGMSWISSSRNISRGFWIVVVFLGFSGAGYLIHESFNNWEQSPISTTEEILPISEIHFPNVTVCPPKGSYLDLNYAMMESQRIKLDSKTRRQLLDDAIDDIQENYYKEIMRNLSKIQDPDRYFNWYKGYTEVGFPYYSSTTNELVTKIFTSAVSGNISTQYFGGTLDTENVDNFISNTIRIDTPIKFQFDYLGKSQLVFNIEKTPVSDSDAESFVFYANKNEMIDPEKTSLTKNFTKTSLREFRFNHRRKSLNTELKSNKLKMMPGFKLTWFYDSQMKPKNKYSKYDNNKNFVR